MSKRERVAHTARFLQTFHTAGGTAPADTAEEAQAVQFLSGGGAHPQADYAGQPSYASTPAEEIFIKGWRIKTGLALITPAQAKWVVDIAETKDGVTDEMVKSLAVRLEQGFARSAASAFITKYKDLPARVSAAIAPGAETSEARPEAPRDVRDASGVKAGRYALVEDGITKFYRVTEGKGRWAGRTFVEAQASDDLWAIRNPNKRAEILKAIAENPMEAEQRYGQELGRCSRCNRTLTDETSRAYGIGPDCRNK